MFETLKSGRGPNPYTVAIVVNTAIEVPKDSGNLFRDRIRDFRGLTRRYVDETMIPVLRGELPGLVENPFDGFGDDVRFIGHFEEPPVSDETALISEWAGLRRILEPRRRVIADFLRRNETWADVVFCAFRSVRRHRRDHIIRMAHHR